MHVVHGVHGLTGVTGVHGVHDVHGVNGVHGARVFVYSMRILGPDFDLTPEGNDFDISWLDFPLKKWSKTGLGQSGPLSNHWFFLSNNDKS